MEGSATAKASSLRWKILKHALLRRPSTDSDRDNQSEIGMNLISRRAAKGFNLIPFQKVAEDSGSVSKVSKADGSRDVFFCYTLPNESALKLYLFERVENRADLNDFEICNKYDIDNTGLVCHWPSEDVLAYYCLSHAELFRSKKVIELGAGYGLAGIVISAATEAQEVVISDGNPQVVDYIQRNINANSSAFGHTEVKSMMLHWNKDEFPDISNTFDIIVASDCTFFKEFHKDLARTVRLLLKEGPSEALFFSPRRGDSLDKFLSTINEQGLQFSITEIYDTEVWRRHQRFTNGDDCWPNYVKDHCYPLLVRIYF